MEHIQTDKPTAKDAALQILKELNGAGFQTEAKHDVVGNLRTLIDAEIASEIEVWEGEIAKLKTLRTSL